MDSAVIKEQIRAAIAAHGQWKMRLVDAIKTGKSEFNPTTVKMDNQCAFGKWMYGLPDEERNCQTCQEIRAAHAKFHQTAGHILELALAGQNTQAEKEIGLGSDYARDSAHLVTLLSKWNKDHS